MAQRLLIGGLRTKLRLGETINVTPGNGREAPIIWGNLRTLEPACGRIWPPSYDSKYAIAMNDGGILLKKARDRAGMTQRSLAARAGVPQSTVGRIETGTIEPRIDTLLRLLHASGHDLELARLLGEGVDRGQIRERLARTPLQRIEDLTAAAAAMRRLHGRARKPAS